MKKIALLYIFFFATTLFSQDLTSKLGEPILPQEKDWSIGIDATRLLKNASFEFVNNSQAITAKYFKTAKTAYRIGVRLGVNNWNTKSRVIDRVAATSSVIAYPAEKALKDNTWKRTATAIGLSFGVEKRRGATRLQGVYGVEGGLYISSTKDKFSYGNALNAGSSPQIVVDSTDAMTSTFFGAANNIDKNPAIQGVSIDGARMVERKSGITLSLGARVFIGAEYFVLPKMSVGGEFGWGLGFSFSGRSETTYESIGTSNVPGSTQAAVKQTTIDGGNSRHIGLDTDNSNMFGGLAASLRLNLYF